MAKQDVMIDMIDIVRILLGFGITLACVAFVIAHPGVAEDGAAIGWGPIFVLMCHAVLVVMCRIGADIVGPKIVNTNHDLETHRRVLEETIRQVRRALILQTPPLRLVQDPVWGYVEIQEARPEQVPVIYAELGLPLRVK